MTVTYLPEATDFTDITPRQPFGDRTVQCPKCHGHGMWNLRLDAYPGLGRTPEQRHFRGSCAQCWGWGFVAPTSTDALADGGRA